MFQIYLVNGALEMGNTFHMNEMSECKKNAMSFMRKKCHKKNDRITGYPNKKLTQHSLNTHKFSFECLDISDKSWLLRKIISF